MGRTKGSKNKPKEATQATLEQPDKVSPVEKPKRSPGAKKTAKKGDVEAPSAAPAATHDSSTQHRNLVIMDAETGEIVGPDKSLDLNAPNGTRYSHSFIQNLCNCTASGWYRRTKAPARKVFALERGSVAHVLIEDWEKFNKDPLENFDNVWRQYILDNKDKMSPEDQEKIEKGYEDTKRMLSEFVDENKDIRDEIRPEDVEVPFEIEVTLNVGGDKQIKRTVVGKIDLIRWLDRKNVKYTLIDHKTSVSAPGLEELARNTQFAIYALAAEKLYGKPPAAMYFYHLAGTHMCSERFSSVKHPREIGKRVPNCEINYAVKVPRKTPEQTQNLLDTYYAPAILRWEAQSIGKDGLADPKNRCVRCEYKEFCDTVTAKDLPVPIFVR